MVVEIVSGVLLQVFGDTRCDVLAELRLVESRLDEVDTVHLVQSFRVFHLHLEVRSCIDYGLEAQASAPNWEVALVARAL